MARAVQLMPNDTEQLNKLGTIDSGKKRKSASVRSGPQPKSAGAERSKRGG